ncbi:MAG: DUF6443 domain-containing protein [Chryseolinea sp.]
MKQIVAVALLVSVVISVQAQLPSASEYSALIDFYQQMDGPNWTNKTGWASANPTVVQSVVGWYGVQTDANGHVTHLDMDGILDYSYYTNASGYQVYPGNALSGTIPASIGNLLWLRLLNVGGNNLTGPLPATIGNLTELQGLVAAEAHLVGEIPSTIGNCTKLIYLFFNNNQLTGPIPSTIGNLTELWAILLNNNQLSGSIPSQFGNLKKVQYFHINSNQLTGAIPAAIGNMTKAASIGLQDNQLSGAIPQELGRLKFAQVLYLTNNKLTGSIPDSLSRMSNLSTLNISNNQLSGEVPPGLASIPTFATFLLSGNKFSFTDVQRIKPVFSGLFGFGEERAGGVEDYSMNPGDSITLTTLIDRNTVPPSNYAWYRDGVQINPTSTSGHTITITEKDFGGPSSTFLCLITNDLVPYAYVYGTSVNVNIQYASPSYVRTITPLAKFVEIGDNWQNYGNINVDFTYYDGLGRPIQSVQAQRSPQGKDLVTPFAYDEFGRQSHRYLPFASGNDGEIRRNQFILTADNKYKGVAKDFYNSEWGAIAMDSIPFSTTDFEPSPLNRPLKDYGPGAAWSPGGYNKPVTHQYLSNVHNASVSATDGEFIIVWQINSQGMPAPATVPVLGYVEPGGYYSSNQLSIKVTIDEEGHAVREYTNKQGQVILKKVQAVSMANPSLNDKDAWACTYYIYDDLDNLVFVLQPEGYKQYISLSQN